MITGLLVSTIIEYGALVAPKTGDTSITQFILRSLGFFTFMITFAYSYVFFLRKLKKCEEFKQMFYPDRRLGIDGQYVT